MPRIYAFYAGMIYGEYDVWWPNTLEFPDGLYLRTVSKDGKAILWYLKQFGSMTPINHCDVPKNLLALCLILGVSP